MKSSFLIVNLNSKRLEYEKRNRAKEEKERAVFKLAVEMKNHEPNEFVPVNYPTDASKK